MAEIGGQKKTRMKVRPLTPYFGGLIDGIDLSATIEDTIFDQILREFVQKSLIVIPGQKLTPKTQIDFSKRFGALECHVLNQYCLEEHPEILVVSNLQKNGRHIGAYGGSKKFHTDLAYIAEPSLGSLFYCLECPIGEGETSFISMSAVYEALPVEKRDWLEDKQIVFDYGWHHDREHAHRPPMTPEQRAKTPPVTHPAVRTHPVSGRRSLYVSEFHARQFVDMSEEQSQSIFDELIKFATQPEFGYTHSWTPGDLVIWDNRCLLHKAMPFDEAHARRLMHRTTVKGDKPFLNAQ